MTKITTLLWASLLIAFVSAAVPPNTYDTDQCSACMNAVSNFSSMFSTAPVYQALYAFYNYSGYNSPGNTANATLNSLS